MSHQITFKPLHKQHEMFKHFDDATTREIFYGGAAGGGKSYGLCCLIILKALTYPGIRIGLARNELTVLKKTTMVSFMEVVADWNIGDMISYNSTDGIIKFKNKSEVILCELTYLPSDPHYTRLGGLLLTFGAVDEIGEVDFKGYGIFKSRLGRWRNEKLGIKPICVNTCNPIKNWLYKDIYIPFTEGRLKPTQKFIQVLPTDNPHLPPSYIENLGDLPYADRQRLLFGNWEYEDDPNALLTYSEILNIFENTKLDKEVVHAKRYITADIAFTSDKLVIAVWMDLTVVELVVDPPRDKIEDTILSLAKQYGVASSNIAFDSDGVGKFLEAKLRTAVSIVNNGAPLKGENYKNLKTQLFYKLCKMVEENKVKIQPERFKEEIIEDLQVIRHKPSTDAGKLEIISKTEMKRILGRSPDFADALAYRLYFEYKQSKPVKAFRL